MNAANQLIKGSYAWVTYDDVSFRPRNSTVMWSQWLTLVSQTSAQIWQPLLRYRLQMEYRDQT